MAVFTRNALVLLLLMFTLSLTMCVSGIRPNAESVTHATEGIILVPNDGFLPNETRVNIINDLGADLTLRLHCQSGDDDLGEHVLTPLASYEFKFRPNLFRTTQYWCGVEWQGVTHFTDIYIQKRDDELCDICKWVILPDGTCLFNYNTKRYDICYPWNKP